MYQFKYIFFVVAFFFSCQNEVTNEVTSAKSTIDKEKMAASVKAEFLHAWRAYKKYAWGSDALKPLTQKPHNWYANSLLMTPVDAFDTMLLMDLEEEAKEAKDLILKELSFDHDMYVQGFEVVIRVLGGLISAYQMDGDKRFLELATDLGNRLLPMFDSPTGLPYRLVNLKTGETRDPLNNSAEIGTLFLEFGTLSKLTENPVYYEKARRALVNLYHKRSEIDLVGTIIDVNTGEWIDKSSHITGRIDSYYEYLLKAAIIFDEPELQKMYDTSILAVNKYLLDTTETGIWYAHAHMETGERTLTQFGALDAFMPAMLALGGDLETAKAVQESCYKMWVDFKIEPEQLNYKTMEVVVPFYVLRPENIESATYLYHHTGEERYLEMGKTMFESIKKYCRLEEGYSALSDITTMERRDDMESFFFAETLKYAYLLFDESKKLDFVNTIFTTEAHPIRKEW